MKKVRKAVVTAAGWGTRFLPTTKSQPKEMLPLVDRPIIQYAVEEAVAVGMEQIILVTAWNKQAIEDYFDCSPALEHFLEQRGELALLDKVRYISDHADICYVRQKKPLGLGDAVLTARSLVGEEPFALFLPDDVIVGGKPAIGQLLEVYERYGGSVLAVEKVAREETPRYGVIRPRELARRTYQVLGLVEKPSPQEAPSELAVMGRYILSPQIFPALQNTPPGKNGEVQLTDGLQLLLQEQAIFAYEYEGTRYDAGVPLGWLKAMVSLSLEHPEMGPEMREYLRRLHLSG